MKYERNYGIDLCRIFAIYLVLCGHMIWNGGLMDAANQHHISDAVLRSFHTIAACNINLFALISGFVGVTARHRMSSVAALWVQIVVCSLAISAMFSVADGHLPDRILPIVMPVTYSTWWYFTAFFALFFAMPIINIAIESVDRRVALHFILLVLFCGLTTWFTRGDPFRLNGGASFVWLLMLYIVGGILRKHRINLSALSCFCSATTAVVIACFRDELFRCLPFVAQYATRNCSHISPFVIVASVLTVLGFSKLKIKNERVVRVVQYFSPTVFGVYILHTHPLIWTRVWRGAFAGIVDLGKGAAWCQFMLILSLLLCLLFFFLCCQLLKRCEYSFLTGVL